MKIPYFIPSINKQDKKYVSNVLEQRWLTNGPMLKKFEKNVEIIKGDSKKILPNVDLSNIDYVFIDGGHSYETVKSDLNNCKIVIENKGIVLCDDYNLSYAPGVKKAIDEYVLLNNFNLKILSSRFAEITANSI